MGTYEAWARGQVVRRHKITIAIGVLALAAVGGTYIYDYLYTYAPVVGQKARLESAITATDEEITAQLDQNLDAYLSRLAPFLQQAGFSPKDFKDNSEPAFRWTNSKNEPNGEFTSVRSRTAEHKDPSNEISIRASMSAETIRPSEIEARKKRGLKASSHLSIVVKGRAYCAAVTSIMRAAASRPAEPEAAQKFDRTINDAKLFQDLRSACENSDTFPRPSSQSLGVRLEGTRMTSGTRWMVSMLNSYDVKIWDASASK